MVFLFSTLCLAVLVPVDSVFNFDELKNIYYGVEILQTPMVRSDALESQDPTAMVVTSIHGQSYQCTHPNNKEDEDKEKQQEQEAMETGVTELLKPLADGPCLVHTKGWWTYELCFAETIKQFHMEEGQIAGDVIRLGLFESDYNWDEVDSRTHKKRSERNKYHSQQYVNGSLCDITNNLRKAEVRYYCEEGAGDYIKRIDESETCVYLIAVHTSRLCHHPYLKPAVTRQPMPITCSPLLSAQEYDEYIELLQADEQEEDIRSQQEEAEPLDEEFTLENGKLVKIENESEDVDISDEISEEELSRIMSEALQKALAEVLGEGALGEANAEVDMDVHVFKDVGEIQKNIEKLVSNHNKKMQQKSDADDVSSDAEEDDESDEVDDDDEIDDDDEADSEDDDVLIENEEDDFVDDDSELLNEFERELSTLKDREKIAEYRDNIESVMNSKFSEILEEAEHELDAEGDGQGIDKKAALHELGKTLDKLLDKLDKAEKDLDTADTILADKIDHQQAKINKLKRDLGVDLNSKNMDREKGTDIPKDESDEIQIDSNSDDSSLMQLTEKSAKSNSENLAFHSSLQEGERKTLRSKEGTSSTLEPAESGDKSNAVVSKRKGREKAELANSVSTKVHENNKEALDKNTPSLSDKTSDKRQNIEIKVITSGYIDKDGSLHMLDEDENNNINQMIVAILGRGGAEEKESERQQQLHDGYNFQWNKKQRQSKKDSAVVNP